jgi:ribosome recycling factor
VNYDFSKIKNRGEEIKEWLKKEFVSLRTSRATSAMVENILVDSYGSKTPLKHVASIAVEDARTLRITPWDHSMLKSMEHAIVGSSLGISPIADKNSIRLTMPELTEERRKALMKIVIEKLEEAKVSLRKVRDEVWQDIQNKEKKGEMPEDDKFRFKDELQKIIDKTIKELEEISERKNKEIIG